MTAGVALAALIALTVGSAIGCASGNSADPRSRQASTAIVLANATLAPRPPPPTPKPPTPGRELALSLPGIVALGRNTTIDLVDGQGTRTLFRAETGGNAKDPSISPDGRRIAFAYAPPRPESRDTPLLDQLIYSDILVVDASGGSAHPIARHDRAGAILEGPRWWSDGKSVLYSYYAPTYRGERLVGETYEARSTDIETGTTTTVVRNASWIGPGVGGRLAWVHESAADGPSLRFRSTITAPDVILVAAGVFDSIVDPRISPIGSEIAFVGARLSSARPAAADYLGGILDRLLAAPAEAHGLPLELWTIPTVGGEPRQVTQIAEDGLRIAWNAGGDELVAAGGGGIYAISVATGQVRAVHTEGTHGGIDWRSKR